MSLRRVGISLLLALAVTVSLVLIALTPAKAQPSLSTEILSFDRIGIDANNPGGVDPQGNPVGPDKSNIQARITNGLTETATNVVVTFKWTTSNQYVSLSPYETLVKSLGDLAPGEYVDVFWVVEIARNTAAIGTTRSFSVDVTSDLAGGTAAQTLTVEGLIEQSQDYSNIVNVPATINLGETFIVEAEATMTRSVYYVSFPLQFDRSLFELEYVQLDYYTSADFTGGVAYTEYDTYYSDPNGILYKGIKAYYTLQAIRAGTGTFASLQVDANRQLTSFHYNSGLWAGSMEVVASNPALTISKSDSPDPAPAGSSITYDITYGNTGNADATNVVITDYIPTNTTYVSGSASGETGVAIEYYDGFVWSTTEPATVEAIRWVVGTLAVGVTGQQAGFQVTVDPGTPVGTLIENTATITSDQTSSAEGAITTVGSPPNPVISKIDWPDPVEPGAAIIYTITYENTGGADANNVTITDSIPTNTTYVSGSVSGEPGVTIEYYDGTTWSTTEPATVEAIRWVVGTLGAGVTGQQAGFQVVVAPDVAGGTFIENTATITSDQTPQSAVQITTVANQPPVAVDDAYSVDEDTTLNVPAPGVLGNDSDAEGAPLTAVKVSDPANGTLTTFNSDGSFSYTPNPDFSGTDTFTYKANDGAADSNIATVTITVNPINDPPLVSDIPNQTINEGQSFATINLDDYVTDPDNLDSEISWSWSGNVELTVSIDANRVATIGIPSPDWNGSETITFTATDPGMLSDSDAATFTVNPTNEPPVAVNDSYSTNEDTTLNVPAPGVLGNDSDADGDPLTAVKVSDPANGTLTTFNSNGSFSYTPNPGFSGTDTFTYQAFDGQAYSNTATVTISVGPPPSRPVPVFPSIYVGIAAAFGAGTIAYFARRRLIETNPPKTHL